MYLLFKINYLQLYAYNVQITDFHFLIFPLKKKLFRVRIEQSITPNFEHQKNVPTKGLII